jgi:hypothetical protein
VPSLFGQLVYEHNSGEYIYILSYADVSLKYDKNDTDIFMEGTTDFELYILSAQYNGEKFSLTGEYLYQKNNFFDFGPFFSDSESISESWYIQGAYRFKPNWQVYTQST